MENKKKYAIVYHSTMTDTTFFFINNNKNVLLKNQNLFEKILDLNFQDDFQKIYNEIIKKNIIILNNEVDNINEKKLNIIKKYSFRF